MLVDDDEDFLHLSKMNLEKLSDSLDIITCTSAKEALDLLAERRIDVIVSDYQMPHIDGLEFLQRVQALYKNIPFIIFTGKSREEVAIKALNLGASHYITKGVDIRSQYTQLNHSIEQAYGHAHSEKRLRESEERYRTLVESAPYGVVVHRNLKLVYANPYARELLALDELSDISDRSVLDILHPDDREDVLRRIKQVSEKGKDARLMEQKWIRFDDSEIKVEVLGTRIKYEGKNANLVLFNDITDREKADLKALVQKQEYEQLLDLIPAGIQLIATDPFEIVLVNKGMEKIFGYSTEEFKAMSQEEAMELVHEDFQRFMAEQFRRRTQGIEEEAQYTTVAYDKSGKEFPLDVSSARIEYEGRNASLVVYNDATHRLELEKAIENAEREYEAIFNSITSGLHICELNQQDELVLVDANPAAKRLAGVGPEEIGRVYSELYPQAKESGIYDDYLRVAKTGEPFRIEANYYKDEHIEGYFLINAVRLPNDNLCIAFENVTALKEMENKLSNRISELDCLYDCTQILNRRKGDFSRKIEKVLDRVADSFITANEHYIQINLDDREWRRGNLEDDSKQICIGISINGDTRGSICSNVEFVEKSDEMGSNNVNTKTMLDALSDQIALAYARHDAERRIQDSRMRLQTLLQSLNDMVFVFDKQGIHLEHFTSDEKNYYVPPKQFMGKELRQVLPRDVADEILIRIRKTLEEEEPHEFDYMLEIDGEQRWFSAVYSPHPESGLVVSVVRDITDRKLQERALENQREELGRLAHRMKHDLTALHSNVINYLELMESAKKQYKQGIRKTIERAQSILNRSVELADAGLVIGERNEVDLNLLANEISESTVPENIQFKATDLPTIKADREKLGQICINLFINAVKHGKPTRVTVESKSFDDYTEIHFCNDGEKIDSTTKEVLFSDPLTSDRKIGMGLFIVSQIVNAHDWDIHLDDSDDTCFVIQIPSSDIVE